MKALPSLEAPKTLEAPAPVPIAPPGAAVSQTPATTPASPLARAPTPPRELPKPASTPAPDTDQPSPSPTTATAKDKDADRRAEEEALNASTRTPAPNLTWLGTLNSRADRHLKMAALYQRLAQLHREEAVESLGFDPAAYADEAESAR